MLFTIGHSTLSEDAFVGKCRDAGVRCIVDVRSHPTSKWDWFKQENLEPDDSWLRQAGIGYRWVPELGGWNVEHAKDQTLVDWLANRGVDLPAYGHGYFPKNRIAQAHDQADSDKPSWTNQGLYDYAWFTATNEFLDAALALARESQMGYSLDGAAMMCSEFVWWKCHRSMIADFMVYADFPVTHVMPATASHKRVIGNRIERYPADVRLAWDQAIERARQR